MRTLTDLKTLQAEAATTYNSAVQTLYSAYIALASLDQAIAASGGGPLRSFGSNIDDVRAIYLHGHPLAAPATAPPISTQVAQARDVLIGWQQP